MAMHATSIILTTTSEEAADANARSSTSGRDYPTPVSGPARPVGDRSRRGTQGDTASTFRSVERQSGHLGRHGHPAFQGLRVERRHLARPANRLRSGASARARPQHQSALFQGGLSAKRAEVGMSRAKTLAEFVSDKARVFARLMPTDRKR